MMDPNILDIDSHILNQIETILENKSTRETFLKAVPPNYFSNVSLQLMDNEAFKYHMTTAKWLLFRLGREDVRVSNFIQWLEEVNLQKALILLKKDVPLQITEQPPPQLSIQKGAKLLISCKARGYPNPEYQWFKGEKELLMQEESELLIECVNEDDAGLYICLIYKHNIENDEISWIYSNPVQVDVIETSFECPSSSKLFNNTFQLGEISTSNTSSSFQQNVTETYNPSEKIKIAKQPYCKGQISQGNSVSLICKAASEYPVNYQWYKNGRVLIGETSCKLDLIDLYPDQVTGDIKWEYFCEVSNTYDKVFSRTVVVELENACDTTPYYASEKYAFMVANDKYDDLEELRKPANDVSDLGNLLQTMKFNVFAYKNLTLSEMKNAFNSFCKNLKPNCYVLFYFAGHGFEQYGQMYLNPVDCSKPYNTQECICAEYILKYMQEAKPSLNILLIDACRNLPPTLSKGLTPVAPPGKIFEAKMKNNTFYGYSTTFLCSSHECDSETNSFFVKYLKKHIAKNISIQNVFLQVQRDFEVDPFIKGVQFPVIKSSLCGNRKFCDEILNDDPPNSRTVFLKDIKGDFISQEFQIPSIKSTFTFEINPHLDVFLNQIDVTLSLYIEEAAPLIILNDLELNLVLDLPESYIPLHTRVRLKDIKLKFNSKILLLEKQICNIQKLKHDKLDFKLLLNFVGLKIKQERTFSISVKKITDMKLSVNYLG